MDRRLISKTVVHTTFDSPEHIIISHSLSPSRTIRKILFNPFIPLNIVHIRFLWGRKRNDDDDDDVVDDGGGDDETKRNIAQ